MLSGHLYLGLPSGLFPSGFPTSNLYTFLYFPIRATCPTHLLIDLIILIILGEEYKLFGSCTGTEVLSGYSDVNPAIIVLLTTEIIPVADVYVANHISHIKTYLNTLHLIFAHLSVQFLELLQ
jgi:hypothetical protein